MKTKQLLYIVLITLVFLLACQFLAPPTVATRAPTSVLTEEMQVEPTDIPVTPTSLPNSEIVDDYGVPMVLVPEGEFTMGSENGDSDEIPVHQVYLDAFYIDTYEVTNTLYDACVEAGVCAPPRDESSNLHESYYGNPQFDNYPVIYVDTFQAQAYCKWRDASLPTEAQWEKAARGTDARTYPWGEEISCTQTNYYYDRDENKYCVGDTTEVGSYESGKSPYGVYDMAGNVSEWVADWYDEDYYTSSPFNNPLGPPNTGQLSSVIRSGSWSSIDYGIRSASRYNRSLVTNEIGFRCAKNATP